MNRIKLLVFSALTVMIIGCKEDENALKNAFEIDTAAIKPILKLEESINLGIINKENRVLDSTIFYINTVKIGSVKGTNKLKFDLNKQHLGVQNIKALLYFEGKGITLEASFTIFSSIIPEMKTLTVINSYPHDIEAYTQGFEFYNGILFEGTGQYKESTLRKTDYKTGKIIEKIDLEPHFFGEGITILNGKIYQLTWKEKTGFIYDATTLKKEGTFEYETEGWGFANDGENLYRSDGTEKIYRIDPKTMKELDFISVYTNSSKIEAVNELEWVNGKIWANIYQKDAIAIIDPKTGAVEQVINCSELRSKVTQHAELDAFNGIAFNNATQSIFVTGKNWDKIFEIKVN